MRKVCVSGGVRQCYQVRDVEKGLCCGLRDIVLSVG